MASYHGTIIGFLAKKWSGENRINRTYGVAPLLSFTNPVSGNAIIVAVSVILDPVTRAL